MPAEPVVADDVLPECFLANACVEVWSPDGGGEYGPLIAAATAFGRAGALWMKLNGVDERVWSRRPAALRRGRHPWSFDQMERTDPKGLADKLAWLGLPAGWRPSPAPAEWLNAPW